MFRASSEIAVATTARSVTYSPHCAASSRPFWRAVTMSTSEPTVTRTSTGIAAAFTPGCPSRPAEVRESLLEVERGRHAFEREPELDHRERDLRLDADDDRLRTAQPNHVSHVAESPGGKRINHVERRDVDDDPARAEMSDLLDQDVTQLLQILVREGRLNGRDQVGALLEDGDLHGSSSLGGLRCGLPRQDYLIPQQPLGLLDAALEVAHGVHLPQVHADVHERLGDLGRQAGDDHDRAEEPRRLDRLDEVVGHGRVDVRDAGDVQHYDLGAVGADPPEPLLRELARALRIDHADDRQDQQALAHLQDRRRQLSNGLLLFANNPLALLDEPDGDRDRDAIRGGFVRVQDAVELGEILVVLREQRAREHVAEEQHDPDDLVRLHASRNDALGQVSRVRLQRLVRPRLERLDVVVVDRGRLGEDLFFRHRRQQLGLGDEPRPLFAQLGALLAQVRDELAEPRGRGLDTGFSGGRLTLAVTHYQHLLPIHRSSGVSRTPSVAPERTVRGPSVKSHPGASNARRRAATLKARQTYQKQRARTTSLSALSVNREAAEVISGDHLI